MKTMNVLINNRSREFEITDSIPKGYVFWALDKVMPDEYAAFVIYTKDGFIDKTRLKAVKVGKIDRKKLDIAGKHCRTIEKAMMILKQNKRPKTYTGKKNRRAAKYFLEVYKKYQCRTDIEASVLCRASD